MTVQHGRETLVLLRVAQGQVVAQSQAKDRWSRAEHPRQRASGPPRPTTNTDPRGHYSSIDRLEPELRAELDERFPSAWPPDDATIDSLELDDVIVFAVESETKATTPAHARS